MLLTSLSLLVLELWLPCGWAQGLRNCPWLLQVNAWRLFPTACKGLLPQSGSVALWLGHESLKTLLWESWCALVSSSSRYPVQNSRVWFCSLNWLMLLHVPTKKAKRVDSCKVYFCYFILMFCQTLVIWLASWKAMWSESFQLLPGAVLGSTEGTQLRPPACQQRIGLVSSILPPTFNWTSPVVELPALSTMLQMVHGRLKVLLLGSLLVSMSWHWFSAVNAHFIFTAFDFNWQCGLLVLAGGLRQLYLLLIGTLTSAKWLIINMSL